MMKIREQNFRYTERYAKDMHDRKKLQDVIDDLELKLRIPHKQR
jgi:hypothetical protein